MSGSFLSTRNIAVPTAKKTSSPYLYKPQRELGKKRESGSKEKLKEGREGGMAGSGLEGEKGSHRKEMGGGKGATDPAAWSHQHYLIRGRSWHFREGQGTQKILR